MKEVGFDSAFMFKYSERPGTYAAKHLPDNVSEETKIARLNELIKLHMPTTLTAGSGEGMALWICYVLAALPCTLYAFDPVRR